MKCIAILVLFALATANAGVITYDGLRFDDGFHYTHPLVRTLPLTHTLVRTLPETTHFLPSVTSYHYEPTYALKKEPATYTAQTKGSLHIAPLVGHEMSETSLNLA